MQPMPRTARGNKGRKQEHRFLTPLSLLRCTMWERRLLFALPMIALCISACSDIDFDLERYKGAVRDGFKKIPQSREIEELLGDADHFISYSGSRSIGQQWNTEVYFAGRYSLTMQVEVKVDRAFSKIVEVVGEPKFYLVEIAHVERLNDGRVGGGNGEGFVFGPKDWSKVVKAKGDFSVIGIKLKLHQPVKDFDRYVKAARRQSSRSTPRKRTRRRKRGQNYLISSFDPCLPPMPHSIPGSAARGIPVTVKNPVDMRGLSAVAEADVQGIPVSRQNERPCLDFLCLWNLTCSTPSKPSSSMVMPLRRNRSHLGEQ